MAKLTRQTLKLFGSAGSTADFAKFGSQAALAPVKTKVIATIQALAAWDEGWQDAVAIGQAPYLEDMNALLYVHSYEQVYTLQEGIAEWDAGTTYYIGGVVKYLGNSGYAEFYASRIDTNLGNATPTRVTDTNWNFLYAIHLGSGLIIPGTTTNDDAGVGDVGEYIRGYAAGITAGTSGQFKNIATIDLTAGDWDVNGVADLRLGATTLNTPSSQGIALSLFSNNTTTDHVDGDNNIGLGISPVIGISSAAVPAWRVSLAAPATVYLKGNVVYTSTAPTWEGRLSARRVR